MGRQEEKCGFIQKQRPGIGPKLELPMNNSKCFHRLPEELDYPAELTHLTQN